MANELVKMAIDLAKGSTANFSTEQVNESLRQKFIELNGGSDKITFKTFRKNSPEIFEIIEEALDILIPQYIDAQFSGLVDFRNIALGDKKIFTMKKPLLFKVAKISAGNSDLRRQRMDNGSVEVTTDWYGVSIYEEFERFLSGRISWTTMVALVAESFNVKIATDIYSAIYNTYTSLNAKYKAQGAFDQTTLVTMAQHIQAQTGVKPVVYGTLVALQKAVPTLVSQNMMDEKNDKGFYGRLASLEVREIQQAHDDNENFVIADDFLLILPQGGEKLVKFVVEGEALVREVQGGLRKDNTLEYEFRKKWGMALPITTRYGIYKLA